MRNVDRQKVEDWLARCRWLTTTKLDDRTRERLDRLILALEQDLEEDEFERPQRRFGG
jgi:O-methyltransferase involved in polyketide biosynthesis